MRRREFIAMLGGATAMPFGAHAQERVRRIGVLVNLSESNSAGSGFVAGFRQALRELGWEDGRNVRIDMRWGAGNREKRPQVCGGIGRARARRHFRSHGTDAVVSVQQASPNVPVVFSRRYRSGGLPA